MKLSIYDFFEQTASKNGEKIAVIENGQSWNFGELKRDSLGMAAEIIKKVETKNVVVGVLLKKSYSLVCADLAITASGCAYMNLDYKSPIERIRAIISNVEPSLIITDGHGAKMLAGIGKERLPQLIVLDGGNTQEPTVSVEAELREYRRNIIDTDPYCLINTSGSTGTPKAVVLNHRSFVDFITWSSFEFSFDGSEIMGSLSPAIFDIFSFELCLLSFKGASLCLIDDQLSPFPAKILEIVADQRVNFIFWVPTIMVNMVNLGLLDRFSLPDLRMVWFAGEVFPTVSFNKWFDRLPHTKFVNLYGPIEITLDCTYYLVPNRIDDDMPIPMGVACKNTSLIILNEDDSETKDGDIGELCVRGTSLAMGYYNNPEATEKAFVQNPLNGSYPEIIYKTGDLVTRIGGLYYFRGRADTLIKHLGYRIELSEVEHSILTAMKEVDNVCVVYVADRKEIVAYCDLKTTITIQEFRAKLKNFLPNYMIPSKIVEVESLQMNANGKIDRLVYKKLSEK